MVNLPFSTIIFRIPVCQQFKGVIRQGQTDGRNGSYYSPSLFELMDFTSYGLSKLFSLLNGYEFIDCPECIILHFTGDFTLIEDYPRIGIVAVKHGQLLNFLKNNTAGQLRLIVIQYFQCNTAVAPCLKAGKRV